MRMIDLSNRRFGKLRVVSFHSKLKNGGCVWMCDCDCGSSLPCSSSGLISKRIVSCGCKRIKHGKSRSDVYRVWSDMKIRCLCARNKHFKDYGGRGIKVCYRWMKFDNFLKDMGNPLKGMSLDRIDNNKGYSKKNCRWATNTQQANNKRNSRIIKYKKEKLTITQWANKLKINKATLYDRAFRSRISSPEKAIELTIKNLKL